MMHLSTVLIGTRNAGKLREIRQVMGDLAIEWKSLSAFPDWPEPQEHESTFEGNAMLKARAYSRLAGIPALADDSGLEVDALDGAPGVLSARYAGAQGDDDANNCKLIGALANVPPERRTARFRCVVVLADGEDIVARGEGAVEGIVIDEPQGANGFGYDPHFWVPTFDMTTAQMPPEQKNRISHRGQALRRLREQIERLR